MLLLFCLSNIRNSAPRLQTCKEPAPHVHFATAIKKEEAESDGDRDSAVVDAIGANEGDGEGSESSLVDAKEECDDDEYT